MCKGCHMHEKAKAKWMKSDTYVLLKLCKGFLDAILYKDHSFPLRPALGSCIQTLTHSQGE